MSDLHAAILAALAELRALGIQPQPTVIYDSGEYAALVLPGVRLCKIHATFYEGQDCPHCKGTK